MSSGANKHGLEAEAFSIQKSWTISGGQNLLKKLNISETKLRLKQTNDRIQHPPAKRSMSVLYITNNSFGNSSLTLMFEDKP